MPPLYEYSCEPCESVVELLLPLKRRNDTILCEACHTPMERIMSLTSFQIDGEGVYDPGFSGAPPKKTEESEG